MTAYLDTSCRNENSVPVECAGSWGEHKRVGCFLEIILKNLNELILSFNIKNLNTVTTSACCFVKKNCKETFPLGPTNSPTAHSIFQQQLLGHKWRIGLVAYSYRAEVRQCKAAAK